MTTHRRRRHLAWLCCSRNILHCTCGDPHRSYRTRGANQKPWTRIETKTASGVLSAMAKRWCSVVNVQDARVTLARNLTAESVPLNLPMVMSSGACVMLNVPRPPTTPRVLSMMPRRSTQKPMGKPTRMHQGGGQTHAEHAVPPMLVPIGQRNVCA